MNEVCEVESLKDNPNYCKCPRCLHYHTNLFNFGHSEGDLDKNGNPIDMREKLCNNCVNILLECFPDHPSCSKIIENFEKRGCQKDEKGQYRVHLNFCNPS